MPRILNFHKISGYLSGPTLQPAEVPTSQPAGPLAMGYSGDLWHRSALTGDWFGLRNRLAEKGVTLDVQTLQYLQGNAYGGRSTNGAFGYSGNAEYGLSFDFQKMGLWSGGFAKIRGETKWGEGVAGDVGAIAAPNFNTLLPLPGQSGLTTLTEYWYMQYVRFVHRLRRLRKRKVLLIVDRHPVHLSAEVKRWLARHADRLPDLNPDEFLNQDVKSHALGRQRPATRTELIDGVRSYLRSPQRQPAIVKSYFQAESVRYAAG